jgi:hypothetical protein
MDYAFVGRAVGRFGKRLEKEPEPRQAVEEVESELSHV